MALFLCQAKREHGRLGPQKLCPGDILNVLQVCHHTFNKCMATLVPIYFMSMHLFAVNNYIPRVMLAST